MPPSPAFAAAYSQVRLLCESCGIEAEGAAVGWMALLGREDDDRVVVVADVPSVRRGEFETDWRLKVDEQSAWTRIRVGLSELVSWPKP